MKGTSNGSGSIKVKRECNSKAKPLACKIKHLSLFSHHATPLVAQAFNGEESWAFNKFDHWVAKSQ